MTPTYVISDPAEYLDRFRERLLALGCSQEYADRTVQTKAQFIVQVRSSVHANNLQCGRGDPA